MFTDSIEKLYNWNKIYKNKKNIYILIFNPNNHNYNKILSSDWLWTTWFQH